MAANPGISIFFDLETTDLLRVGQIINFCFLVVDKNWSVIDSLTGNVRISPVQLPRASAIVANRTVISKHQKEATFTEREALHAINSFVRKYAAQSANVPLIGYNSDKFDTHYLRTSLLRNGVLPYLPVEHKDLLCASRSLLLNNERFRSLVFEQATPNLKLETLCKAHKLLEGAQLHESRADVELTIKLAETFSNLYGVDIRTFEPYQLTAHHEAHTPIVVRRATPRISATSYESQKIMLYLSGTDKASLWVDLEAFEKLQDSEEAKDSIKYLKHTDACSFLDITSDQERFEQLSSKALKLLGATKMNDLYPPKGCYVEEWIYLLNFSEMQNLLQMIDKQSLDISASANLKTLYNRYFLEVHTHEASQQAFRNYSLYRYGGKMIVDEKKTAKGIVPVFHPTIDALYQEIKDKLENAKEEDRELLLDLKNFYDSSPIPEIVRASAVQNGAS